MRKKNNKQLLADVKSRNRSTKFNAIVELGKLDERSCNGSEEKLVELKKNDREPASVRVAAEKSLAARRKRRLARRKNGKAVNDYGIQRDPYKYVMDEVRKRSGYGCVMCRRIPVTYEHFCPEFADLKQEHSADGIALLCHGCHGSKTVSKSNERRCAEIAKAYLKGQMEGWGPVAFMSNVNPALPTYLTVGNHRYEDCRLRIGGTDVFWIRFDSGKGTWLVDLHLTDEHGRTILQIEENAFSIPAHGDVDVEVKNDVVIRCRNGRTGKEYFKLDADFPAGENDFCVSRLDCFVNGLRWSISKSGETKLGVHPNGTPLLHVPGLRADVVQSCVNTDLREDGFYSAYVGELTAGDLSIKRTRGDGFLPIVSNQRGRAAVTYSGENPPIIEDCDFRRIGNKKPGTN